MKKILLLTSLLLLICCKKEINYDKIITEKYTSGKTKTIHVKDKNSGQLKFIENFYKTGELEGVFTTKPDENNGTYVSYYKNGKIESEGNFKNGFADGKSVVFHENGRKLCEKNFYKNKIIGDVMFNNNLGTLERYQNYNHLGKLMYDLELKKENVIEKGNKFAHVWVGLENQNNIKKCKKGENIIISLEIANPPNCKKILVTKLNGVTKDSITIKGLEYNYKILPTEIGDNKLECFVTYKCSEYKLKPDTFSVSFDLYE